MASVAGAVDKARGAKNPRKGYDLTDFFSSTLCALCSFETGEKIWGTGRSGERLSVVTETAYK